MKKFFTVFVGLLIVASGFAQPEITQLWEFSTKKGNLPNSNDIKNDIAYYNGEILLGSRRGIDTEVVVYDAATGLPKMEGGNIKQLSASTSLDLRLGGGVAVDQNGAVYAIGKDSKEVVKWESTIASSSSVFVTLPGNLIYSLDVYVDSEGNGCLVAAPQSSTTVYYVPIVNNIAGEVKTITLNVATGSVTRSHIVDVKTFWVDGSAIRPTRITLNESLEKIKEEPLAVTVLINAGVSGVAQFSYHGKTYLIAAANNHSTVVSYPQHSAALFELDIETLAVTMVGGYLPESGMGGTTDYTHVVDPAVYVAEDGVYIYLMGGSDGISAFKFAESVSVEQIVTPVIQPESGEYNESLTITISTETPEATIRYTLDGTDPTESSTEYTAPFELAKPEGLEAVAVKAKAWLTGWDASEVASVTYTFITVGVGQEEVSALKVYSANGQIVVEVEVAANVEIYNLQGQKVVGNKAVQNVNRYTLDRGVYIVKVQGKSIKVIL